MSDPILTVWLPMPLADAGPILDAAIQDQLGRRVEVADAPVSRAEWRAFCAAKGRKMPEPGRGGWSDDKPVTGITRRDAEEFCEWAGVRLPTEKEWLEKIGDAKTDSLSVWEHVAEMEGGRSVLRGGSWYLASHHLRAALRNYYFPDARYNNLGFRVARDIQAPYVPDTEHCWGIRCCMCLQEDNVKWTPLREACVIDLLEGRLFCPGQVVQRSVQVLSVNCPPEKAGIRVECWHVPAPHDEGDEK